MFDRLVESDTAGAEFKNRSRYFMVSSVVVGILFLTAVVISLYAADIGIGNGNFEIAELISPVTADAPEPEQPRTQPTSNASSSTPRNVDSSMARVDEPTVAPTGTSSVQNTQPSRGIKKFDPFQPESFGSGEPGGTGRTNTTSSSAGEPDADPDESSVRAADPPPLIKKAPTVIRQSKLLNGSAIFLPKPSFPKPAEVLRLQDSVSVQVTIDEEGRVISAKAASGHMLFRQSAEQAARNAKFKPTYLNDVAVKVTGVIVYNFRRTN